MRRNSIEAIQERLRVRKAMKKELPMKHCQWCESLMPAYKAKFCSNKCQRDSKNRKD